MQSVACPQCHALVPAGVRFCGSCGSSVTPALLDPTTPLQPPPVPPETTVVAKAPPIDPYAAQYSAAPGVATQPWRGQPTSLPPTEALGWTAPPVLAQASPPRRRRRGLLIASLLVLLALLGGGGYLALTVLHLGSANTGATSGASGTDSGPVLPAINRQAIYAGAAVTIQSAEKAHSFPEFQKLQSGDDVVKVKAQIENQTPAQLPLINAVHLLAPDGSSAEPSSTNASGALVTFLNSGASAVGFWYFEVNHAQSGVGVYKIILGGAQEVQETVPFTGTYDPSIWQWVTRPVGKSVTYHVEQGAVIGTVAKVSTGIWTPGHQAPQGMRFVLTDMLVANQTALPIYVSGDAIKLQAPGGIPESPATGYGYFINDSLSGGQNKDEGYASFLVPPAKGDFVLFFYNADGSVAGQVDLGIL